MLSILMGKEQVNTVIRELEIATKKEQQQKYAKDKTKTEKAP